MENFDFDYTSLEPGYEFQDVLELIGAPHYTNSIDGVLSTARRSHKPRGYTIKVYSLPDMDEEDQPIIDVLLLVVWDLEKYGESGPTADQIRTLWMSLE